MQQQQPPHHEQQLVQPPDLPSAAPSVLVIATGATMFLAASECGQRMELRVKPHELLAPLCAKVPCRATLITLPQRSGAELLCATVFHIRDLVVELLPQHAGAVLLTGTDTMDEAAFMLHLLLGPFCTELGKPLVLTGAMKPSDAVGADGSSNALDALRLATHPCSRRLGVVVAINDSIHLARYVVKGDSQLMGSFTSHPGPIGQLRNGQPLLYYMPAPLPTLPTASPEPAAMAATNQLATAAQPTPIGAPSVAPPAASAAATGAAAEEACASTQGAAAGTSPTSRTQGVLAQGLSACSPAATQAATAGTPAPQDATCAMTVQQYSGAASASSSTSPGCGVLQLPATSEEAGAFLRLSAARLRERVAIWTVTMSAFLPEVLLSELDGLVLAAPGTGSLPAQLMEQLSPHWTHKLPIVISSRCATGNNHDCYLYIGSRGRYEDKGFLLSDYQHLTPLQARILLMLRLSAASSGADM